jgi:hypothetical protein
MTPQSASNETNQDSDSDLAVHPGNPWQMSATTSLTPDPGGFAFAPFFVSRDRGHTWTLNPSFQVQSPAEEQPLVMLRCGKSGRSPVPSWAGSRANALAFLLLDCASTSLSGDSSPLRCGKIRSMFKRMKLWWQEFRRPKCRWCGAPTSKEQYQVCDKRECIECHRLSQTAP